MSNRIITLEVRDAYLQKCGESIGASGSANALTLRMVFGNTWDGTTKTVYFLDANGENPVSVTLGLDMLVEGTTNTWDVKVPKEPLAVAGNATVTVRGVVLNQANPSIVDRAITTVAARFRVLDAEIPVSVGNAGTITAMDKEQLQNEIDALTTLFTTTKAAVDTAVTNAAASAMAAAASAAAATVSETASKAAQTAAEDAEAVVVAAKADVTANKAAAAVSAAAAAADVAGFETDEARRAAAENARVTAETTRADAEAARVTAESGRASAEQTRASTEQTRASEETARISAENSRASAEQARGSAEQARASKETERAAAEALRESAESARNEWVDYDGTTAYVPGNKVAFNGSSYLCTAATTGNAPTNTAFWRLIAARGTDGQGAGDMLAATYDPNGKAQDIFAYADQAKAAAVSTVSAHNATGGAHQNLTIAFTEATTRANIAAGETLAVILGKIRKFFKDLGTAAFSAASDFAAAVHTHTKAQITDFPTSMTPSAHNHTAGDIASGVFADDRLPSRLLQPNLLSDATAVLLGNVSTVDSALELLGRFNKVLGNEYVWKKAQRGYIYGNSEQVTICSGTPTTYVTIYYSTSIQVSNGVVALVSPSSVSVAYDDSSGMSNVVGKYCSIGGYGNTYPVYKFSDTGSPIKTVSGSTYTMKFPAQLVTYGDLNVEYVNSASPDAYPPSVSDGYTYTLLGQLGSKVRIATGSYTGTGTYGSSDLNTIPIHSDTRLVIVQGNSDQKGLTIFVRPVTYADTTVQTANAAWATEIVTWSDSMLSWYYYYSASGQLNALGVVYYYTEIRG